MANLSIFIIASIIISRFLEKKMKVASICYTIMFILLLTYFMLILDIDIIINIIGINEYKIIKEALIGEYNINTLMILEIIIIVLFIISLIISITKIKEGIEEIVRNKQNKIKVIKEKIKKIIEEQEENKESKRIYISYCKFIK